MKETPYHSSLIDKGVRTSMIDQGHIMAYSTSVLDQRNTKPCIRNRSRKHFGMIE